MLLEPGDAPLHDVALRVAHRIHQRRPATPGTPTGTGGLLVGSLRDGVGDPTPAQQPVGCVYCDGSVSCGFACCSGIVRMP
jgi:hypothetical protein